MKICEICGAEIIDGVNGCTFAGSVCFSCKPWNMKLIVREALPYEFSDGDAYDAIMERQERYLDD